MTDREINKLRKNKKVQYCYITKGNYYRPNSAGYTDFSYKAGVYPKDVAIRHAEKCRALWITPINPEAHNSRIMEQVRDLLSRIIDENFTSTED